MREERTLREGRQKPHQLCLHVWRWLKSHTARKPSWCAWPEEVRQAKERRGMETNTALCLTGCSLLDVELKSRPSSCKSLSFKLHALQGRV
jgi:hypothetical protein